MKQNAFSLVELVIALAVTFIIATIVMVTFKFATGRGLDVEARTILADLQTAREMAVSRHRNYIVTFDVNNETYSVFNGTVSASQRIKFRNVIDAELRTAPAQIIFSPPWGTANNASINITGAGRYILVNVTQSTGFAKKDPAEKCPPYVCP